MSDERERITFEIPGRPEAKRRPEAFSIAGRTRVHKRETDRLYEAHVRDSFYRAVAGKRWLPLTGPVVVHIAAMFEPPTGTSKAQRAEITKLWALAREMVYHDVLADWLCEVAGSHPLALRPKRPDLDNIIKSVLDGLNGHAFKDDGQVVGIHAVKLYGSPDRTLVGIEGLGTA